MMQRNYAFIDAQNLFLSVRDQGWELDYQRFFVFLKHKYRVTKAFLFVGYLEKFQHLYDYLSSCGFTLIYKPVLVLAGGNVKGNVDAELVLHTMIQYNDFDQAILVTGDGDFHCLVEYLLSKEKLYKVLIPNRHKFSQLLKKFMNKLVFLSDESLKTKLKKR